jgi:hypothetical protein
MTTEQGARVWVGRGGASDSRVSWGWTVSKTNSQWSPFAGVEKRDGNGARHWPPLANRPTDDHIP